MALICQKFKTGNGSLIMKIANLKGEYFTFIETEVLPKMGLKEITENNIDDIYDFIVEKYEIPYIESKNPRLKFINIILKALAEKMKWA